MAKAPESKAVAVTEEVKNQVAVVEVDDYGDDVGGGFGNQSSADYAIPFVDVLQSNSPELNDDERLRAGMLFNRTTADFYSGKDGIVFVPAYTDHCYTEWVPRDDGGGYVGRHEIDSRDVTASTANPDKKGKLVHPTSKNDMIETFYVYGVMIDGDDNTVQCVIPFTSTKIGVYRAWMTKARQQMVQRPDGRKVNVPLWGHRYLIQTKLQERNNYKWHNFDIGFDGENAITARLRTSDDLYVMARELFKAIESGHAKADMSKQGKQTEVAEGGARGGGAGQGDEEIPF